MIRFPGGARHLRCWPLQSTFSCISEEDPSYIRRRRNPDKKLCLWGCNRKKQGCFTRLVADIFNSHPPIILRAPCKTPAVHLSFKLSPETLPSFKLSEETKQSFIRDKELSEETLWLFKLSEETMHFCVSGWQRGQPRKLAH